MGASKPNAIFVNFFEPSHTYIFQMRSIILLYHLDIIMHARNPFSPQAGVIKDHSYYLFFNDFKTVWSKGAYVADRPIIYVSQYR